MNWEKRAADNRIFFDSLIRLLFVEINLGSKEINPYLILPSYHSQNDPFVEKELGEKQSHYCTIVHLIKQKGVDFFNNLLSNAPKELIGCRSIPKINRYIKDNTDFSYCQLSAANAIPWNNE